MTKRGGPRVAGPGKSIGRPKKADAKTAVGSVRKDVAHEVIALLNVSIKDLPKKLDKASGEAQYIFSFLWDEAEKKFKPRTAFAWDVYRYIKECVDSKPMVRSEEKMIFDPDAPIRVLVEHIGSVSVTSRGGAR